LPAVTAIAFFGAPLSAQNSDNFARIQGMLETPDVLCGAFEQSKTLVGLRKPVVSSGRFCVVADRGVLWRTLRPFPATLRLTRNEITEYSGDQVSKRLSAEQEPAVRMITDLLFSVLAGELSRLAATFDVASKTGAADWQATLTPRDAGMKKAIGRIEMQGGAYVGHIVIHEAGGDRTDITFSSVSTGKSAMLPEEAKLFAR
jgi:hypothetical protein